MLTCRPEQPKDSQAIELVHETAFPTRDEAQLVARLREHVKTTVSLVAELDGSIVGHILFSPVSVGDSPAAGNGVGLAPVAVLPAMQRRGIGTRLIQEGIDACRQAGCGFAVVLGEPSFYARFGFRTASLYGLGNEYGVDAPFMVLELCPGALPPAGGLVRYSREFSAF